MMLTQYPLPTVPPLLVLLHQDKLASLELGLSSKTKYMMNSWRISSERLRASRDEWETVSLIYGLFD